MAQPQITPQDHLAKAREYLAIAESEDSRREAYMKAAEEIVAHKDDKTLPANERDQRFIALKLEVSTGKVSTLLKWRRSGYSGSSPWEADQEQRNARSDQSKARGVLRDRPAAVAPEIAKAMEDPEVREQVARHMTPRAADDLSDRAHDQQRPDLTHLHEQRRQREGRDRTEETGVKWLEAGAHLGQAERRIMRALEVIRYVEWSDDAVDGLEDYVQGIDEAMALVKAALRGDTGTDWDAELDNLLATERNDD